MSSAVVHIQVEETKEGVDSKQKKSFGSHLTSILGFIRDQGRSKHEHTRKVIHSIKVGIALVLVSLFYLLDPLYNQVGENAMWAIMTVVIMFEFYAGATLSKGINRGIGTVLGGGLGCIMAFVARRVGRVGDSALMVGSSVFIFGAAATYTRLIPSIKRRYDYGALIFILTFTLVVVSGLREEHVLDIAGERLATIGIGFVICVLTSFLVFLNWASNDLRDSITYKFENVASSLEGCLEDYFVSERDDEKCRSNRCENCVTLLDSKAKDEMLANFARWEPWHAKLNFSFPSNTYMQTGESLRELAVTVISLRNCLQSPKQPLKDARKPIMEPCRIIGATLAWTLRELRESIVKSRRIQVGVEVLPKLKTVKVGLNLFTPLDMIFGSLGRDKELAVASFTFVMLEILEKIEELAGEVEELGELSGFPAP